MLSSIKRTKLYNSIRKNILTRLEKRGFIQISKMTYCNTSLAMASNKNCDFLKDASFLNASNAGLQQWGCKGNPNWGGYYLHLHLWAAKQALNIQGDLVECGCYRGSHAMAIAKYISLEQHKEKRLILFDTFSGLAPEFCSEEETLSSTTDYKDDYEDFVRNSFSIYDNAYVIKGAVPKSLEDIKINAVSYLHIDMNCVLPEQEALKHFWPKLSIGGIVILDDYAWPGHEKQKKSHDDFASQYGIQVLSLPTGQGLLIKV